MGSMLAPASKMQQSSRDERLTFSTYDDGVKLKQIQAVHSPDGRVINVRSLLNIVEDVFTFSTPSADEIISLGMDAHTEALEDQTYQANVTASLLIDRISSEMACKCTATGEAHATTMSILNMVSYYPWDAKLVIALSAFAANYGEFWLLAQSCTSNQLAKILAMLKQVVEILEQSNMLKSLFDTIKDLIGAMLDIAKCVVEFMELTSKYITTDVTEMSEELDHISIAIYWTIRSMLASASQIIGLSGSGNKYLLSTTEFRELSSFVYKLSNMHSHLARLLKHEDERKFKQAYQNLLYLFETAQDDNINVLKALINPKDDPLPLVNGATKKRVNVDVLRGKYVLLLISDLDISEDEVAILEHIFDKSQSQPTRLQSQYEFVWLPVLEPSIPLSMIGQDKLDNLNAIMTWYILHHPSLLDGVVFKFIKEVWQFEKKPILVVLDPVGRVACPNALHMMWIWGTLALPFTTAKENALWRVESWRLDLLVDGIDHVIQDWISEGSFVFLYGGDDIEWIRKFTNSVHYVARASGLALKMVYVGNSNPKELVQRNMDTITVENLSYCLPDLTAVWFFWTRIESMWLSKHQLGKADDKNDPITREIMALLLYDASEGGWALLSKGSTELTRANGSAFLACLSNYDLWAEDAQAKGLVLAIHDYLLQHPLPHHCNRLVLAGTDILLPERVICFECGCIRERYILYHCCDDIDERYQKLLYLVEKPQVDNIKFLKALINPKDDLLPLVNGATKKRVNVDVLRGKNVLLLISDLDISEDEVAIIEHIFDEYQSQPTRLESQYEFLWLPVLNPSIPFSRIKQNKFDNLNAIMTWYILHRPSMLDGAAFKFIKEVWHFKKKPILVVLDPQGQVACLNALQMMWIWGASAFPFNSAKENALWRAENWRLDLLVDDIDHEIQNWISEGSFIFLYGGDDMDWIRKFTNTVCDIATASGLALETVYVGKSNLKEHVQRNIDTITVEKLSYCLPNLTAVWYFWTRIKSMWHSKNQLGKADENDTITREIMALLSYDGSKGGWALLGKGSSSTELIRAKGNAFLACLSNYKLWAEDVQAKGFVRAIRDYILQHPIPHICNRIVLPHTHSRLPEKRVICSECGRIRK